MLKNLQIAAFTVDFSLLAVPKYNLANIYWYKRSTLLQNITKNNFNRWWVISKRL